MLFPRADLPALATLALTLFSPAAWAQTTPPAAPSTPISPPRPAAVQAPPGYAPPPAGYAPPPAGYAPPPAGYAYAPAPGYGPPPGYSYASLVPAGPAMLPYEDGARIPDGYRPEMRFRTGLIVAGATTFGSMYLITALTGSFVNGDGPMFVPVVGPFIEVGQLHRDPFSGFAAFLLVFDGVAQTAGAAMLIGGLASKKHVLVRQDVATTTVRVTPLTMGYAGAGVGIGLVGEM